MKDKWINVYTDGACSNNGKVGSKAGIGVFFSDNNPNNYSGKLKGCIQSNNRAEIYAVIKALNIIGDNNKKNIRIFTDSKYVIESMTKYIKKWSSNGWKLSNGRNVKNKDLFTELNDIIEFNKSRNIKVELKWIKGHSNSYGNQMADKYARMGINK